MLDRLRSLAALAALLALSAVATRRGWLWQAPDCEGER
jgi:hypothetical protein